MLSIEGHAQRLHDSTTDAARCNSAVPQSLQQCGATMDCLAARPACVLTIQTIAMPHAGAASHRKLLRKEAGNQIKGRCELSGGTERKKKPQAQTQVGRKLQGGDGH